MRQEEKGTEDEKHTFNMHAQTFLFSHANFQAGLHFDTQSSVTGLKGRVRSEVLLHEKGGKGGCCYFRVG